MLDKVDESDNQVPRDVGDRMEDVPSSDMDPPPLTFSFLGRFLAVPLLIISTIVGGAVTVVLLFGGPASPQQRTIEQLVQALEASSGERSMGVLLTREKELWQAALELSLRLENKDKESELNGEKLTSLTERLGAMVRTGLGDMNRIPTVGEERDQQRVVRSRRLVFLVHALGWTDRPEAVGPLLAVLTNGDPALNIAAMEALGRLSDLEDARTSVGPIADLLNRSGSVEVQLVASTVLSLLASPGDPQAIDALQQVRFKGTGEVAWSASLSLARLGSNAGKTTLLDLLDRGYLESGDRYEVRDRDGAVHRYPLPPRRVDELLVAAIDAAAKLEDKEIWGMIEALALDPSPVVRGRAMAILKAKNG